MTDYLLEPSSLEFFLDSSRQIDTETLFVCHASYEVDRARKTAETLTSTKHISTVKHALVIGTSTSIDTVAAYKKCFYGLIETLGQSSDLKPQPLIFSRSDLVGMTKAIHASIGDYLRSYRGAVVIDASVFPKDRFWMLMDYFTHVNPSIRVFVVYTEPAHYATELNPDGWLSKGVKRIIRVPGFNGRQNPRKQSLLVLIVGHEKERMEITIKNIEPQKIVLVGQGLQQHGNATPVLPRWIVDQLGADYSNLVDRDGSVEIGSRDHLGTKQAIQSVFDRFDDKYNVMVSANGTKLQSLGALLACQDNRAIAAIYAEPQIYNSGGYSVGVGHTWVVRV